MFVGPLIVRDSDGNDIAHVGNETFSVAQANAEAIAAVPDLIVALEQCKRQSAFLMDNLTRDARVVAMQINAVASAALAKADGTS